ncbi:MAG: SpoIIE family protein phosphatase [Phycisphaerales bacterium]
MVDSTYLAGSARPPTDSGLVLRLVRVSGPECDTLDVPPATTCVIGRRPAPETTMQLAHDGVSRRHARIDHAPGPDDPGTWTITDLGSRNGTFIDDHRLERDQSWRLRGGERVRIGPWTFVASVPRPVTSRLFTIDEDQEPADAPDRVDHVDLGAADSMSQIRLAALTEAVRDMAEASEPEQMVARALWALEQGGDFDRYAMVRVRDAVPGIGRAVDVLGQIWRREGDPPRYSGTLLRAASEGRIVRLDDAPDLRGAESIIGDEIKRATCIPVYVGDRIDGFVYLDSLRLARSRPDDETAFAASIAGVLGLQLEAGERRRQERELAAAHAVQRRLMPADHGRVGGVRWAASATPGRTLAGDFFNVQTSGDAVVASIGDVSGKGPAAALLMATAQAWVTARLPDVVAEPARAATDLDAHVASVSAAFEFITMMLVSIDPAAQRCQVVDAGHGWGAIVRAGGQVVPLRDDDGGLPVGMGHDAADQRSVTHTFGPNDRIVLMTDGVVEQAGRGGIAFGHERALSLLSASSDVNGDIDAIMHALRAHAGGDAYEDDVTVVSICLD